MNLYSWSDIAEEISRLLGVPVLALAALSTGNLVWLLDGLTEERNEHAA